MLKIRIPIPGAEHIRDATREIALRVPAQIEMARLLDKIGAFTDIGQFSPAQSRALRALARKGAARSEDSFAFPLPKKRFVWQAHIV